MAIPVRRILGGLRARPIRTGCGTLLLVAILTIFAAIFVLTRGPHREHIVLPVAGKLRIDGVTVVDPRSGTLTPGMSVLMDKGRITGIVPVAGVAPDPSFQVVNAAGKFVVPGYNNMHAHALGPDDPSGTLALMLAEGVTGFRQMSGSPEILKERRDGKLPIGKDSPALLAMPGDVLTPFNAGSTGEVAAEIQRQKRDGADFIKLALASPEVFYAAIAEAKRVGLPIVGHLQPGVDAAEASRAGFRSVEHLGPGDMLWIDCATNEAALRAESARHPAMKAPPFHIPFLQEIGMWFLRKVLINPAAYRFHRRWPASSCHRAF